MPNAGPLQTSNRFTDEDAMEFPVGIRINGSAGGPGNFRQFVHQKRAIADNTATDFLTVTVPAGNQAALIKLTLLGTMGRGGADEFESSRCATGIIVVSRRAGETSVPVASTLAQTAISTTSGGGTLTLAYGLSSITGTSGVNTFTITVTLVKTGTVDGHICTALVEVLNCEPGGVTVAVA